jgi:hypothetical protein
LIRVGVSAPRGPFRAVNDDMLFRMMSTELETQISQMYTSGPAMILWTSSGERPQNEQCIGSPVFGF